MHHATLRVTFFNSVGIVFLCQGLGKHSKGGRWWAVTRFKYGLACGACPCLTGGPCPSPGGVDGFLVWCALMASGKWFGWVPGGIRWVTADALFLHESWYWVCCGMLAWWLLCFRPELVAWLVACSAASPLGALGCIPWVVGGRSAGFFRVLVCRGCGAHWVAGGSLCPARLGVGFGGACCCPFGPLGLWFVL